MTLASVLYDPFDPLVQDDPYPIYQRLRDEHPVYRCESRNCWVVSRYDDVFGVLNDAGTYSSAQGVFPTRKGVDSTQVLLPMMIMMDAPNHTRLRAQVGRAFTPRRIALLEPAIRAIAVDLIAGFADSGGCDIVADLAGPLPAMVIADLLGVPREDHDRFSDWSAKLVASEPGSQEHMKPALEAAAALYEYFGNFIEERRRAPQDDLVSALTQAETDGEPLGIEELLGFCLLLLVAGHETTSNLIGNGTAILAQHSVSRIQLASSPHLIPDAVEELLRYDSPVQALARTLTRDRSIHGTTMSAGDTVLMLFGSANRDEAAFPQAERFDIQRKPERQVAFGYGSHFCLGAFLARLEARIVFEELLVRLPSWSIDVNQPSTRTRSGPVRGFSSLPIVF